VRTVLADIERMHDALGPRAFALAVIVALAVAGVWRVSRSTSPVGTLLAALGALWTVALVAWLLGG
jgi:uncharacterized membrane protein (UPF0136 family)